MVSPAANTLERNTSRELGLAGGLHTLPSEASPVPSKTITRTPTQSPRRFKSAATVTSPGSDLLTDIVNVRISNSSKLSDTTLARVKEAPPSIVADSVLTSVDEQGVKPSVSYVRAIENTEEEAPGEYDDITEDTGTIRVHDNGYLVYDTDREGSDGRVPTHRLDVIKKLLPPDTTIEEYEEYVLSPEFSIPDSVKKVENNISLLEPDTQKRIALLMEEAEQVGLNLQVSETFRPQERQEWLFRQGRVDTGNIITWTLTSAHQSGRAIDFIVNDDYSGNDPGYDWLQRRARELGMAPFGPGDPGHIYIPPNNASDNR